MIPGRLSPGSVQRQLQGVIGQLQVAPVANEITAALELLRTLPLAGGIITGDAIFTQREICRIIIGGGTFSPIRRHSGGADAR